MVDIAHECPDEDAPTSGDPLLLVVGEPDGIIPRTLAIDHFPFTVGRQPNHDLVIDDPHVSTEHAWFVRERESDAIYLVDIASQNGTYVNGERVVRRKLTRNDRVEFGMHNAPYVIFDPNPWPANTAQQLISQVATWGPAKTYASKVDMLTTFLKAARKLNAAGVLDEILATLLEAALRRTHAHRVFVFERHEDGALRLLAGRDRNCQWIEGGSGISRDAARKASEYLASITDATGKLTELEPPRRSDDFVHLVYSPDNFLCHPLCTANYHGKADLDKVRLERPYVQGMVCFDYSFPMDGRDGIYGPSRVSEALLVELAEGIATLVQNAAFMKAENEARYIRKELTIAADIQKRLMTAGVPDVSYATVKAASRACKNIGGDFFDVVHTSGSLSLIIADISGKGVAAAVVAATLQGMLYSHLTCDSPLPEMIAAVNRFLCDKVSGQEFATLVVARLAPNGELEMINCGHIPPIVVSGSTAKIIADGNLPVGLIPAAHFQTTREQLNPGDRLLLVTDGVTEAENAEGQFFGIERLQEIAGEGFAAIEQAVAEFRGGIPLNDDCTITEMMYRG